MKIMLVQIVIKRSLSFLSHLENMFPGETYPAGRRHGCSHQPNHILRAKLMEGKQLFRLHYAYMILSCYEKDRIDEL